MSENTLFHKIISRNRFQELRLRIISFETKPYLDVRIWEKNHENSHFHPTKHGLTASPKTWKQILSILQTENWEPRADSIPKDAPRPAPPTEHPSQKSILNQPTQTFPKRRWNKPLQQSGKPLK